MSAGTPEVMVDDISAHTSLNFTDLFTITLKGGTVLQSSTLRWAHGFTTDTDAAGAQQTCAELADGKTGADFRWCLLVRPESSYVLAVDD